MEEEEVEVQSLRSTPTPPLLTSLLTLKRAPLCPAPFALAPSPTATHPLPGSPTLPDKQAPAPPSHAHTLSPSHLKKSIRPNAAPDAACIGGGPGRRHHHGRRPSTSPVRPRPGAAQRGRAGLVAGE